MEIGLILPNTGAMAAKDGILAIADRAESLGLDALWTADHLALPRTSRSTYPYARGRATGGMNPNHKIIEPLIVLATVAGRTERIKLGVSIYIIPFRHPLVNAKSIASLDEMSGGRVIMGVGLGWIEEEYAALGVPWEKRGAVMDEQLRYMREVWTKEEPEFHGEFFEISGTGFAPKPPQGTVPLWIGGNSNFAMRRAAALGDGLHFIDLTPAELEEHINRFRDICGKAGRAPEEVTLSIRSTVRIMPQRVPEEERSIPIVGSVEQIVDDLRRFERLGIQHAALWPPALEMDVPSYLEKLEIIGKEIMPALR